MLNWLVLLDLENLLMNTYLGSQRSFIFTDKLGKAIEELEKRGKITLGIAFTPRHLIPTYEQFFHEKGFFVVACPEVETKEGKKDTTDDKLIAAGKILINTPGLTHLCLGSGDDDFMPLLIEAREKGLRIAVIVGNTKSLSGNVSRAVETISGTNKKDVIVLAGK